MLVSAQQWLLFLGALIGFLGVGAGAFGAHFLKQRLSVEMLSIFEVGVRYQMYHVLAIFIAVWLSTVSGSVWTIWSGYTFLAGIIIFSGSLYLLVFSEVKAWGAITPIGGLLLLFGWIFLALSAFSLKH